MNFLKNTAKFVTRYMAAIVIAVTVPGAIFSAWHNISGAIAANMMANRMGQAASKEEPDRNAAEGDRIDNPGKY